MKNLVIIHLESLNNAFLYQNSDIFPNITKLKENSLFFKNYYSTATSTIMVMSDLMYGNDSCSDHSADLVHFQIGQSYIPWNEQLDINFIRKKAIIYPKLDWKYDYINMGKIMGKSVEIVQKRKYRDFKETILHTIQEMDGDYIYIYDWSSLYMKQECENSYSCWNEYYLRQYERIDNTLGYVFEQLEKYKKLEETLILVFGDHGDDMYSYGKNGGFTHAIAPYPNIVKTPLMIYKKGIDAHVNNDLVCTFDVGNIVKSICENRTVKMDRQFAFMRNLFPLQKSEFLTKSYAVTDGEYLLLASSKGLEMYICRFMSQSIFNLLNWFILKRNGALKLKKMNGMHFMRMIQDQREDIEFHFYKLRRALYTQLKQKEDIGLLKENIKWWFTKIYYNSKE